MSPDPDWADRINSYALVSYIPGPLGAFIDQLRRELTPACFLRAHVTLLPPRPIRIDAFAAYTEICEQAITFPPVEIELGDVEVFRISDVIHISVKSGADRMVEMHNAFSAGGLAFSEPFPYHPHITLAQGLTPDQVDELTMVATHRWAEYSGPRTFSVRGLTFVQNTRRNCWADLGDCKLSEDPNAKMPELASQTPA